MTYLATSINESPVISEKAGAAIADVRGKAVKYDTDGNVVLCSTAGEFVLGVGIMTNDEATAKGADVDIQIKDIGLVLTGAAVKKGAELAVNAGGKFVTATAGQHVAAIALEATTASTGAYIKARLVCYDKTASGT